MRLRNAFIVVAAAVLVVSGAAIAEDGDQQALYVAVDCMKSTAADYTSVEMEIWQPMHQELVNQGKRNSWALYSVMYGDRSRCDSHRAAFRISDSVGSVSVRLNSSKAAA